MTKNTRDELKNFKEWLYSNDRYNDDIYEGVKDLITTHQKQLLEELLSELPEKENIKNCLRPAIPEAFNECLDQVSALIRDKMRK